MAPRIRYLEWIIDQKVTPDGDLGSSGLGDRSEGIVPEALEGRPDPPEGTELESQIADQYDSSVTEDHVLVTAGASHANVLAFAAALGAATQSAPDILVEQPAYEPLRATPEWLGATVTRFQRDARDGYGVDAAAIETALRDSTALTVVSNRHNPSGHLLDRASLASIAARTRDAGVPLLVDEVYAPYLADPISGPGTAFGGPTVAGDHGAMLTNSLTKFFGLGGLRIGWVIGPTALIDRASRVAAHLPDVAEPSRALARRALYNIESVVERSRSRLRQNAALLREFVADRPDIEGTVHDGATFGFVEHASADGDAVATAASEADLLVIPGRFFEAAEGFRLSVGGPSAEMKIALERFGEVLDGLA